MNRDEILRSLSRITSGMDERQIKERYTDEFNTFLKVHTQTSTLDVIADWIELVQNLIEIKDKKVIDVGCGFGIHSIIFAYYNNEVIGVDVYRSSLNIAQKVTSLFNDRKIILKENDSTRIDCEDSSLDVAYCNEFVSHVYDLEGSLKEIKRVLKEGGKILIADCDKRPLLSLKQRYITLKRDWEPIFQRERKKIIGQLIKEADILIDAATAEKIAQKTRGWSAKELKELFNKYAQGEKSLRKLLSTYKPKFPFRTPETGAYAERLFSPNGIKKLLRQAGYSDVRRIPLSTVPFSFRDKLLFYARKLKGDIDMKYVVVGTK